MLLVQSVEEFIREEKILFSMGTPLPFHEWQEQRTYDRLNDFVSKCSSLQVVAPVTIKAEVYFQPFSDKPVVPFLWGEDGNLYRHNSDVGHWVKPFSQKSFVQHMYSREEVELILDHSKIQYQHDPKEITASGYQARNVNFGENVIPITKKKKRRDSSLENRLTGTNN